MIEVQGVKKRFSTPHGVVDVLKGIDLNILKGERVAILGSSGAGKTTLMHILGALDRPNEGLVRFEGEDIFALRGAALDEFRNRRVGFVFQFHQLLPEFNALENVMMPALVARCPRRQASARAQELLEDVGLGHRLLHKPGELSGGEQQRVAIARALVQMPRLLLADEPTGNLDSGTTEEIYALLERLHREHGLTMVVVTHSLSLAQRMDRMIHMEDGLLRLS
ncbi:ABC transporter ATP-binding protein [Geoalkalibacter halelectricus]|uniref:ABC transporter ATP-binding protein n=1 Tax=Geoalkalibacter halelectricus TaxID=2847045 RepID=A0ABY5ZG88_9BACT|nr:ABC transporter ATP-binding protein [Geoalkalibacter halelectricus]MDO3379559.1 ABC transporter ATP-binding protein [Geoalkalibacter halelectricus]UWZ78147.1 ABC transporter ATP-binding protein [Geoalkalibacter halelectricus]